MGRVAVGWYSQVLTIATYLMYSQFVFIATQVAFYMGSQIRTIHCQVKQWLTPTKETVLQWADRKTTNTTKMVKTHHPDVPNGPSSGTLTTMKMRLGSGKNVPVNVRIARKLAKMMSGPTPTIRCPEQSLIWQWAPHYPTYHHHSYPCPNIW